MRKFFSLGIFTIAFHLFGHSQEIPCNINILPLSIEVKHFITAYTPFECDSLVLDLLYDNRYKATLLTKGKPAVCGELIIKDQYNDYSNDEEMERKHTQTFSLTAKGSTYSHEYWLTDNSGGHLRKPPPAILRKPIDSLLSMLRLKFPSMKLINYEIMPAAKCDGACVFFSGTIQGVPGDPAIQKCYNWLEQLFESNANNKFKFLNFGLIGAGDTTDIIFHARVVFI